MRAPAVIRGFTWAFTLLVILVVPALAQRSALREVREWGVGGLWGAMAMPRGAIANDSGPVGGGGGAFMTVALDPVGLLGIRLEGSLLAYGHDRSVTSPFSTTSYVAGFHAGPQITLGRGVLRPYGFGQVGISYLFTTAGRDDCYCDDDVIGERFDWTWELGAGMMLRLGGPRSNVHLDLGARYLYAEDARSTTSTPTPQPFETQANLVAVHLGVTFGLRN